MKKIKNKEDNNIMKELSSTILFTEKSNISFKEEYLDDKSVCSFLFLSSIYHNSIEELKEHLKIQFHYESKYNISKEEYLSTKDNYFDINFNKLNLNENEEKSDLGININQINNIFIITFFIALLIPLFQFLFIFGVNKEYFHYNNINLNDMKVKIIKYLFLFYIILKTYEEFVNGKKIVIYGIYNGFLYRTLLKRLLSIIIGLVQIGINFLIYFYFYKFLLSVGNIIKGIEIFCMFIVISQVDNWISEFYLNAFNALKIYARGDFKEIYLVKNNQRCNIRVIDCIFYLIFICAIIMPFYKILKL